MKLAELHSRYQDYVANKGCTAPVFLADPDGNLHFYKGCDRDGLHYEGHGGKKVTVKNHEQLAADVKAGKYKPVDPGSKSKQLELEDKLKAGKKLNESDDGEPTDKFCNRCGQEHKLVRKGDKLECPNCHAKWNAGPQVKRSSLEFDDDIVESLTAADVDDVVRELLHLDNEPVDKVLDHLKTLIAKSKTTANPKLAARTRAVITQLKARLGK